LQVNCRGYNAFGRRRRREISKNNNEPDDDALESIQRGQLREEITIESNAILTFERREERLMDPTEGKLYNYCIWLYKMHYLYCNVNIYIYIRHRWPFCGSKARRRFYFWKNGFVALARARFSSPNKPIRLTSSTTTSVLLSDYVWPTIVHFYFPRPGLLLVQDVGNNNNNMYISLYS